MTWYSQWLHGRGEMPDDLAREQSEEAIRLYASYRKELDESALGGRFMPYRWWTLPDPLDAAWLPYSQMLYEFASELSNIINDLTNYVHRLRAWSRVVGRLTDQEKLSASHEFIDMLATVALGAPYAIKSRFAFAAGHLCHQANLAKDPRRPDKFPDERTLYLNDVDPLCKDWKRYRVFKKSVEALAGAKFRAATRDFRHAYNHRFSTRILIGMTKIISREVMMDGDVSYIIGGRKPLSLDHIADVLAIERDFCYRAFEKFQALVEEQIALIRALKA